MHGRPSRAAWLLAILGAFGAVPADHARAQVGFLDRRESPATKLSGRDFAGLRFETDAQMGPILLGARQAWSWESEGVLRAFLRGDARVQLGEHEFIADEAVLWIEDTGEGAEHSRRQVAAYFINVRNPGAPAALGVEAPTLLVTAVAEGPLSLRADRLERERPEFETIQAGEARLGTYLSELLDPPPLPLPREKRWLARGKEDETGPAQTPEQRAVAAARRPRGVVSFFGPTREWVRGPDENAVVISGGVAVNYNEPGTGRAMMLTAERAVIFLEPGSIEEAARLGVDAVRGVYLEGDAVATDGQYTLRASRMYTDVRQNKAVMLDAVFWTYDVARSMPVYLRAKTIRQETDSRWSANGVRLANSSFFTPHLGLGATKVTVTRRPRVEPESGPLGEGAAGSGNGALAGTAGAGGPAGAPGVIGDEMHFDAEGVTLRAGDVPILPLGRYRGNLSNPPLRAISIGSRDSRPVIKTTWDLISLLGLEQAEGFTSDLLIDGYFTRGPALGTDTRWANADSAGSVFGYYIYDNGEDDLTSGAELGHDDDHRGMALLEHRWAISERWALFLEGSYVSDPAFVDSFFPRLAESRREFTNSAYLRRLDEESLLSLEGRGSLNDFTPNEYLLQSQGYTVNRLPELVYARPTDSLFDGAALMSTDVRLSRMQLNFNEPQLNEFGFDTPARAAAGFGLTPTDSLADRLRASGLTEDTALRFDTRHEFTVPFEAGPVSITPFAVARFTAYDDDFDALAGTDEDPYRVIGAAGLRLATSLQRVDNSVDSRLFDLRRIRHIIEPSATLWHGETSRSGPLPIYDDRVENLATGTGFRAGVVNTWQTQRGVDDDLHDVDWLVVRTDYVWFDRSVDAKSPIPRWVESRPELSNPGEFIDNDATMQLTDAVALSARTIFDMERHKLAYQTAGILVDHGESFATFAEFRSINPRQTLLMDFGARYALSRKYAVLGQAAYDLDDGNLQSIVFRLERRFPQTALEFSIGHDNITDDTFFAVALRPTGLGTPGPRRLSSALAETDRGPIRPRPGERGPVWPLRSSESVFGRY